MKLYCYLLFRFYWFFRDVWGEGHKMARISTGIVGALICFTNLLIFVGLYGLINDSAIKILSNSIYTLFILAFLYFLNYYFLLENNKIKKYDFKKSKEGGVIIILYVLVVIATFIYLANINRDKIFNL